MPPKNSVELRRLLLPIAADTTKDDKVRLVATEQLIQLEIMAWEDKRAIQKRRSQKARDRKKRAKEEPQAPPPPMPREMPVENPLGIS